MLQVLGLWRRREKCHLSWFLELMARKEEVSHVVVSWVWGEEGKVPHHVMLRFLGFGGRWENVSHVMGSRV